MKNQKENRRPQEQQVGRTLTNVHHHSMKGIVYCGSLQLLTGQARASPTAKKVQNENVNDESISAICIILHALLLLVLVI